MDFFSVRDFEDPIGFVIREASPFGRTGKPGKLLQRLRPHRPPKKKQQWRSLFETEQFSKKHDDLR